jgi:hypothetical protein
MLAPRATSLSKGGTDRVVFAPLTHQNQPQDENVASSFGKNVKNMQQQQTPNSLLKHKSKIPQPSQPRRALGDISNKKKGLGDASRDAGAVSKLPAVVASPSIKATTTPGRVPLQQHPVGSANKQQQQSTSSSSLLKPSRGGLRDRSISVTRPTAFSALKPPNHRLLEFPVPQPPSSSLLAIQARPQSMDVIIVTKPDDAILVLEPVDDVERPAGRLWSEQLKLDDEDDSSFQAAYQEGMDDLTTMWDDWRFVMADQLQERIRNEEAKQTQADAAFDELMFQKFKLVLDEDGTFFHVCWFVLGCFGGHHFLVCSPTMNVTDSLPNLFSLAHTFFCSEKGLESLLDCVEDIDDATSCGPYGILDDVDDWSEPASSLFGDDSVII